MHNIVLDVWIHLFLFLHILCDLNGTKHAFSSILISMFFYTLIFNEFYMKLYTQSINKYDTVCLGCQYTDPIFHFI